MVRRLWRGASAFLVKRKEVLRGGCFDQETKVADHLQGGMAQLPPLLTQLEAVCVHRMRSEIDLIK